MIHECSVSEVLELAALRWPDRLALSDGKRRLSFAELQAAAELFARRLSALGVGPDQNVVLLAANVVEWVALEFAVARLGAILVPANTALEHDDLRYLLRHSGASHLLLGREARGHDLLRLVGGFPEDERPQVILIEGGELSGARSIREDVGGELPPKPATELDRVVNMQYTSGTTGFPKGVMLSSRNLVENAWRCGEVLGLTEDDRVLCQVPLFHCFGCVVVVLGSFTHGASVHLSRSFDPKDSLEIIERKQITVVHGVPSMFAALLDHPAAAEHAVTSVRTGIMAGADCSPSLVRRLDATWGAHEMINGYGLTEASPHVLYTPRHDPVERKLLTVGIPMDSCEVRLVDPKTGLEATRGELWVRGQQVMKGYYRDPEATAAAIDPEGWLRTGDLAEEDGQGGYRIVGRLKEMILRGGENIYPAEVEEAIRGHEGIAQAAVFGIPDERLGETVAAAVVPLPGAQISEVELVAWLRQHIAHTKCPVFVAVVDSLPMTASGKIQRHLLSRRYAGRKP